MTYVRNSKHTPLNKFGDMKIWMNILIEKKIYAHYNAPYVLKHQSNETL